MAKSIGIGCLLVVFVFMLAGCGAKPEENLIKEQIAILEKTCACFEKVTDKKSMEAAQTELNTLNAELAKVTEELNKLGIERMDAAKKKNEAQLNAVLARLKDAKLKSREATSK